MVAPSAGRARPVFQPVPVVLPSADRRRAVGLGQAVEVGHPEAVRLHRLDHRRGRRRAAGRAFDRLREFHLGRVRRVRQQGEHHRRAAHVGDAVLGDAAVDRRRIEPAQADVGPVGGGHRPGEGPAVAVEHGQRPEVDRIPREPHGDHVADGVQIGAAGMVDAALGVAGGARGVEQGNRLQFVFGLAARELGLALGEQRLVVAASQPLAALGQRVVDVDHQDVAAEPLEGGADGGRELPVAQQALGAAVVQNEGDGRGVEPDVQRVQYRAQHGHAVVGLEHLGRVGAHDGDAVAFFYAALGERRGEPAGALVELAVGVAPFAVDDRDLVGIDGGGAAQEGDRRQRLVVRPIGREVWLVPDFAHDARPSSVLNYFRPERLARPRLLAVEPTCKPRPRAPRKPRRSTIRAARRVCPSPARGAIIAVVATTP